MYVLESFVCQEAWIRPAMAPHLSTWPSNSPSCKGTTKVTTQHQAPIYPTKNTESLFFLALWRTDKTGRHCCISSSPFAGTHWDGSVLSSSAGAAGLLPAFSQLLVSHPGRPAGLSENTHKSHQWQRGRACIFPAPSLANFHWDELASSQWQPLPGSTTEKAKKKWLG